MKHYVIAICTLLLVSVSVNAQQKVIPMKTLIQQQFEFAARQYKLLGAATPMDKMPKSYDPKKDQYETSGIKWWCSGFYPGSLWYIYEYTKDPAVKQEAEKRLSALLPVQHYRGTHDLGFMINCSFGNGYRLTKNPAYKAVLDTTAATLSLRYRPKVHAIQSWNKGNGMTCPVIIDNMMNLELLMRVARSGGDQSFKNIAIEHANTTLKNHFRPDYSSFHVVDYNPATGAVIQKITWQGANDTSAWSRGQSWGLYGYTMMYRMTKDKKYLDQATGIAHFILNNPTMPEDMIPYWDFDAPGIPAAPRDASAAAIAASALLELGQYTHGAEKKTYVAAATKMIRSLASDNYRAKLGENGNFLLMHSTGGFPFKSEVDVPLSYADYYFLEALARYKKWYL